MYSYSEEQMSKANRRWNEIESCKVVKIDNQRGLLYEFPWGGTSWIRPKDFEIEPYWIDMILSTVSSQGHISLKAAKFVGRTPEAFIPKE